MRRDGDGIQEGLSLERGAWLCRDDSRFGEQRLAVVVAALRRRGTDAMAEVNRVLRSELDSCSLPRWRRARIAEVCRVRAVKEIFVSNPRASGEELVTAVQSIVREEVAAIRDGLYEHGGCGQWLLSVAGAWPIRLAVAGGRFAVQVVSALCVTFIRSRGRATLRASVTVLITLLTVFPLTDRSGVSMTNLATSWDDLSLWALGGEQRIERAIDVYDELKQVIADPRYTRLDIQATSQYVSATVYERTFRQFLEGRDSIIRVLILDPRLARVDGRRFSELAGVFGGQPEYDLAAECWLTISKLSAMKATFDDLGFGDRLQVRLYDESCAGADEGYLLVGRCYDLSNSAGESFSVIVPYIRGEDDELDSPERGAYRVKNRPESAIVQNCRRCFKELWEDDGKSAPLDEQLIAEMRLRLSGNVDDRLDP